jgi:DNA-binding NtrC family response regulator
MPPFIMRAKSLIQRNSQARTAAVLGNSAAMRSVEEMLRRVAALQSPLLITGETGAGKEVCARFLHSVSPRSGEPFIAVNCAAIPADVMERELFGARGQGAQGFHHGFAERARSGILFLDEVSDLTPALQAKLLRLVETREYNRVGGEQLLRFHGRIVCSTHAEIGGLIGSGRFREDLFYRINGITVNVPPLRDRADDIPWLIDLFFEHFRALAPSGLRGVSTLAYDAAMEYAWPGNVRELRNRLERSIALARSPWVMPADMFPETVPLEHVMVRAFATLSETRDIAERRQIERALKQTGGQIIEASRLLGVSRTTLWDKMRRLGVDSE